MKAGDKVMIYQKPLTEEDEEGMATLVERTDKGAGEWNGRDVERWLVSFDGDEYERQILAPAWIPGPIVGTKIELS